MMSTDANFTKQKVKMLKIHGGVFLLRNMSFMQEGGIGPFQLIKKAVKYIHLANALLLLLLFLRDMNIFWTFFSKTNK